MVADSDVLAQFQEYLTEDGLSTRTVVNYLADVRAFLRWCSQKNLPGLSALMPSDVQSYLLHLHAVEGRAGSTVNRRLQAIRKLCQFAVETGLTTTNPSVGIKLLKKAPEVTPRTLDRDEVSRLVESIQQGTSWLARRDHAIIQLMLQTGMRVGEMADLRLADVNLHDDAGTLAVRTGKGQVREVPLNASARRSLSSYLAVRPDAGGSDHLFLSREGAPLSVRSIQHVASNHAKAAGLEGVSAKTLRLTCAKYMLQSTENLTLVSRLLGHNRTETTARYIVSRDGDAAEVAEESPLNIY